MIDPLRKRTRDGKLYTRRPEVEAKLIELAKLPRAELLTRCGIRGKSSPDFVPSECLLYFIRASRADNSETHFESLYKILLARVLRALPRPQDGMTVSLTTNRIREKVLDRFTSLLATDRSAYSEKLDFFEVQFDGGLANLNRDAREQAWREENRSQPLEYDGETGELAAEVEKAAGSFDPFASGEIDGTDYRSRLDAAIDTLPAEQIRIIEMLRQGFPIDSKDLDAMTIAKALGKSEKTIRSHRDKALAALRAILNSGEDE
ncbi:RNA polymerase sigma factor [Bradyrhizobium sp. USDA 336]|uniref:RNA polymerase sigma factor n=1 Tax=Bradyrhizobium sp. USDA 336 TaxID=3156311 RepID=UPI00383555A3